jgi:hypothetical protein
MPRQCIIWNNRLSSSSSVAFTIVIANPNRHRCRQVFLVAVTWAVKK